MNKYTEDQDEVKTYSMFDMLGVEGKKVWIIPKTHDAGDANCFTEIHNKKKEFLCWIYFDKRKRWNRFVMASINEKMQMSKDCIDEAFKMCEEYWKKDEED